MKKILAVALIAAIFICGCGPKQITKAYNALSAANAAYNPTGPLLIQISAEWPLEKRKAVEQGDKVLHDAIAASWAALYSWKNNEGTQGNFENSLNAILAALQQISSLVDNATFQNIIEGVKKIIEFYLQIKSADAKLFEEFNAKLTAMEVAHNGR